MKEPNKLANRGRMIYATYSEDRMETFEAGLKARWQM